ncbi:MAG: cupin domain-containing protein [Bacteroidetes bacterium]|nr:cupin domain-containing protein [Bacteroidota bacterium]
MPVIEIASIKPKTIVAGFDAKFIHTASMTFSFIEVKAGASLPAHSHIHEQVSFVTEGIFQLTVDGEIIEFGQGTAVVIPSNAVHSGTAITDCKIMDVFNPVREDYRNL